MYSPATTLLLQPTTGLMTRRSDTSHKQAVARLTSVVRLRSVWQRAGRKESLCARINGVMLPIVSRTKGQLPQHLRQNRAGVISGR